MSGPKNPLETVKIRGLLLKSCVTISQMKRFSKGCSLLPVSLGVPAKDRNC